MVSCYISQTEEIIRVIENSVGICAPEPERILYSLIQECTACHEMWQLTIDARRRTVDGHGTHDVGNYTIFRENARKIGQEYLSPSVVEHWH